MNLQLVRDIFTEKSTTGELFVNGVLECFSLEDKYRGNAPKVYGQTCIPEGFYRVVIQYSPKKKRKVPYILDVPNFTGIQIHIGNRPEDTLGCIIVGQIRDTDRVLKSTPAFNRLYARIMAAQSVGEAVWIEVCHAKEEPGEKARRIGASPGPSAASGRSGLAAIS